MGNMALSSLVHRSILQSWRTLEWGSGLPVDFGVSPVHVGRKRLGRGGCLRESSHIAATTSGNIIKQQPYRPTMQYFGVGNHAQLVCINSSLRCLTSFRASRLQSKLREKLTFTGAAMYAPLPRVGHDYMSDPSTATLNAAAAALTSSQQPWKLRCEAEPGCKRRSSTESSMHSPC